MRVPDELIRRTIESLNKKGNTESAQYLTDYLKSTEEIAKATEEEDTERLDELQTELQKAVMGFKPK